MSNDGASDVRATSASGTHVLEADEPRAQRLLTFTFTLGEC